MAHVYVGDKSKIDTEVLEAVKSLPNDFYVFGEFVIGTRQVDWLVLRVASVERPHSTVVVGELKRISRPLQGQTNGVWRMQDDQGAWQDINTSNNGDTNYYFQAVNTSNVVKSWLYNNQRLFLEGSEQHTENVFKAWPDLLLLSANDLRHQLPIAPDTRFGAWFTSLPKWIAHIELWRPTVGPPYTAAELQRLAEALGLTHIWPMVNESTKVESVDPGIDTLTAYFTAMHQRMADLEGRIRRLENRAS